MKNQILKIKLILTIGILVLGSSISTHKALAANISSKNGLVPMFSYSKDLKKAQPLNNAKIKGNKIYLFFLKNKKFKKFNVHCCIPFDSVSELVIEPENSYYHKTAKSKFLIHFADNDTAMRELQVEAQQKNKMYKSFFYKFKIENGSIVEKL